jgi:hypothetical protein
LPKIGRAEKHLLALRAAIQVNHGAWCTLADWLIIPSCDFWTLRKVAPEGVEALRVVRELIFGIAEWRSFKKRVCVYRGRSRAVYLSREMLDSVYDIVFAEECGSDRHDARCRGARAGCVG